MKSLCFKYITACSSQYSLEKVLCAVNADYFRNWSKYGDQVFEVYSTTNCHIYMALPVCNAQGLPQQRGWKCMRPREKERQEKSSVI